MKIDCAYWINGKCELDERECSDAKECPGHDYFYDLGLIQ